MPSRSDARSPQKKDFLDHLFLPQGGEEEARPARRRGPALTDWLVKNDADGWGIFHLLCGAKMQHPFPTTLEGAFDKYIEDTNGVHTKWSSVVWKNGQLVCERCGGKPPAAVELMARALGVYDRYVKREEGLERIRAALGVAAGENKRKERYLQQFWKAVGIDPI